MPVSNVQFPTFDLLKQPDGRYVLIVSGRAIPSVQRVGQESKSAPAKMFAQQQFRFNRRGTDSGSESNILVVRTGQDGASAEGQGRNPGRVRLSLVKDLIAGTK